MSPAIEEVRRILEEHGLPGGLVPQARSYRFDGLRFFVDLGERVERRIGAYPVRYDSELSGELRQGRISELRGVHARKLLWVPVRAISAEGQELVFEVGPARVRLPRTALD